MPHALLRHLLRRFVPVGLTLGALSISLAGCAGGQLGAGEENLSAARSAFAEGSDLFTKNCAGCHGSRGEGSERGPGIIGLGALPVYPSDHDRATNSAFSDPQTLEEEARVRPAGAPSRPPFRTADDVERYVSTQMPLPKDRVGSLSEQEYWSIVSFVLAAHGVELPDNGVNANNAASVKLKR
jgi:mono/diheme cytochrome c family protein